MKRSRWKGPLLSKNTRNLNPLFSPRNLEITTKIVGTVCLVHTGKKFIKLNITDKMIGHKIGEFVSTRK